MKKVFLILFICLFSVTSCAKKNASNSQDLITPITRTYTNNEFELLLFENDKTFVLKQDDQVTLNGSFLKDKTIDSGIELFFNDQNIIESCKVNLLNTTFSSPYIDFLKLSSKEFNKKYDMHYGLGTLMNGMFTITTTDYYEYIYLYDNQLCQKVREKSIYDNQIVSKYFTTYNIVDDILFIENSQYILIQDFAWPITSNSTFCCNIERARYNFASYVILDEVVEIVASNSIIKLNKGKAFQWYLIHKESYYVNLDFDLTKDVLVIQTESANPFFIYDFVIEKEYISIANNGSKLFFNQHKLEL